MACTGQEGCLIPAGLTEQEHAMTATHLPSHQGTIRTGRVAEPGEKITCAACRKAYEWNLKQARGMGEAAIESAHGHPPPAYSGLEVIHSGLMARGAASHALRILGYLI